MNIVDLQSKQGKVEVEGELVELSETRDVNLASGPGKVRNGKLRDSTGEIKMSFWNEQADQVSQGDKIKISNGYVSEYKGELQLSTGKFGSLEILEKQKGIEGSVTDHKIAAATKDELEEAEVLEGHKDDEPAPQEAATADNIVMSDEVVDKPDEEEKKPDPATENVELEVEEEKVE